jgi:hypothetical protein
VGDFENYDAYKNLKGFQKRLFRTKPRNKPRPRPDKDPSETFQVWNESLFNLSAHPPVAVATPELRDNRRGILENMHSTKKPDELHALARFLFNLQSGTGFVHKHGAHPIRLLIILADIHIVKLDDDGQHIEGRNADPNLAFPEGKTCFLHGMDFGSIDV